VGVELAAFVILSISVGHLASLSELRGERVEVIEAEGIEAAAEAGLGALHPYLGFTLDPDKDSPAWREHHEGQPVSDWGFLDSASPLRRRSEGGLVVGVFGGSVAFWLSVHGIDALIAGLGEIDAFAGREVSVVRVAIGGFKQPQQLLALTYLLSAGAEFDVIINLDGFNEIALPPAENVANGVFALYPRNWHLRTESSPSHLQLTLMGRIALLRDRREEVARFVERWPLRWSMTAGLLWWQWDRRAKAEISEQQLELMAAGEGARRGYRTRGPRRSYATPEQMYADLAEAWRAASLQMHHLAAANGARYWHFLQPNQYLPGSKPMEESERDLAINRRSPFTEHVAVGYPYLREAGAELEEAGVAFHDLTQVFSEESRVLYSDNCCHYNRIGNELLGSEMGRLIGEDMAREAGHRP